MGLSVIISFPCSTKVCKTSKSSGVTSSVSLCPQCGIAYIRSFTSVMQKDVMWILLSHVMGRGWDNGLNLNVYLLVVQPLWMGLCPLGHFPFVWLLLAAQQIKAHAGHHRATRSDYMALLGWHCRVPLLAHEYRLSPLPWISCAVSIPTIRKKS